MTNPDTLRSEALARVAAAGDVESLRGVERDLLGKSGPVTALLSAIPTLPPDQRKQAGQSANQLKQAIEGAIAERIEALERAALDAQRSGVGFDPTLPAQPLERGGLHPITQVTRELEDLFTSMGYTV